VPPWDLWLISGELEKQVASFPTSVGGLIVSKTDHLAQEDALRINWTQADETRYQPSNEGDYFRISTIESDDMTRQSNGAMKLAFYAKSFNGSTETIRIGQCDNQIDCDKTLELKISNDWREYMISLKEFENLGIEMSNITSAFLVKAVSGTDIGLSNIRLE
jgi:beta-glucosidase